MTKAYDCQLKARSSAQEMCVQEESEVVSVSEEQVPQAESDVLEMKGEDTPGGWRTARDGVDRNISAS